MSADTARVVAESLRVSELTGGAFDVTVDPLVRLWGFGPRCETGEPPPEPAIAEARRKVGGRRAAFTSCARRAVLLLAARLRCAGVPAAVAGRAHRGRGHVA